MSGYILHSVESGKGEPVVLLHGYLSSSHYFKHVRPLLEKNFRVIALDLLGFGQSPKPTLDYTYDDHIAAIRHTLASLGVDNPHALLGHSMGALIAARYAIRYPGEISKLLLFNPPLFTSKNQLITHHKATGRRYRVMLYSRGRHVYWLTLRLLPRSRSVRRTAINFTDIARMSPHAREGSYRHILVGSSVFDDFNKLSTPTLLVTGRYDRDIYLENLQNTALPPNLESRIIDADHHPLVRQVKVSGDIISSYLL